MLQDVGGGSHLTAWIPEQGASNADPTYSVNPDFVNVCDCAQLYPTLLRPQGL